MSTEQKPLAKVAERPLVIDESDQILLDTKKFEHAYRVGHLMAKSDLVPQQYRNKPENCVLAFQMATRLKIDPIQLMQNTYIIQGKPGMEAKLVIALVNARGPFKGPIQYKLAGKGKERSCTAYATHKTTKEVCEATVTWAMVEAEGWSKKGGSKWNTMPDLMFQYRSATFLARLYCPEVILGFQTVDELEDISGQSRGEKPVQTSSVQDRLSKPVASTVSDTKPDPIEPSVEPEQSTEPPKTEADEPEKPKTTKKKTTKKKSAKKTASKTTNPVEIDDEERYYCNSCGKVFGKPAPNSTVLLCRYCLDNDVVDRKPDGN